MLYDKSSYADIISTPNLVILELKISYLDISDLIR